MQIPSSLLQSLQQVDGFDLQLFLEAHQKSAITSIRINQQKFTNQFDAEQKVPWATDAFYLHKRPFFAHDPLWHAGAYYVQEASSMFLQHALRQNIDAVAPLKVLDLCAAPGGKSTLVADVLNEDSLLICNEVIGARVNILAENISKWGRANTWVSQSDAKQFGECKNYFDVIIIDAPCSGSGLFRKDENAIAEWSEGNVQLCAQRQERILHDVLPALKPNGILIYMTCSYSIAENESIVDKLLQDLPLQSVRVNTEKKWQIVETQSDIQQGFGYRFFPHLLQGEGFFLACFKKNEQDVNDFQLPMKNYRSIKIEEGNIADFMDKTNFTIVSENDNYLILPNNAMQDYLFLQKHIKLVRKGTLLGQMIKKQLVPQHDMALSVHNMYPQKVALDLTQAQQFLCKENLDLPICAKGWVLVQYQNSNIGWIKNLGNRFNNYYPTNWRIKKQPIW
jgi:16S rRNA C967 or C1407 C5-methylase (RsmB/RsmF family)/NOL1/NOP2/fmu family ribosome biogenesis protein